MPYVHTPAAKQGALLSTQLIVTNTTAAQPGLLPSRPGRWTSPDIKYEALLAAIQCDTPSPTPPLACASALAMEIDSQMSMKQMRADCRQQGGDGCC